MKIRFTNSNITKIDKKKSKQKKQIYQIKLLNHLIELPLTFGAVQKNAKCFFLQEKGNCIMVN